MAKKNVQIMFDKENDIMSLSNGNAIVRNSLVIALPKGDFVVDYSADGRIVGVEFFNASLYFPELKNIDVDSLSASLTIQYGVDWAEVHIVLSSPELSSPLTNLIISPFSKIKS